MSYMGNSSFSSRGSMKGSSSSSSSRNTTSSVKSNSPISELVDLLQSLEKTEEKINKLKLEMVDCENKLIASEREKKQIKDKINDFAKNFSEIISLISQIDDLEK